MTLWKRRFAWPFDIPGGSGTINWILTLVSTTWRVSSSGTPSGALKSADGINFIIDDTLSSGLTLHFSGSNLLVTYP